MVRSLNEFFDGVFGMVSWVGYGGFRRGEDGLRVYSCEVDVCHEGGFVFCAGTVRSSKN